MKIFRRALFLIVVVALSLYVSSVFRRKSRYLDLMSAFQRLDPDSFEVLGVGSSHMYCTLIPAELYRSTGLSSFLLSTQRQPIEISYEYMRRALARHSCKVVILETLMLVHSHKPIAEGIAHDGMDPIPLDLHKLATVLDLSREDGMENYLLPIIKYHSRWRELKRGDYGRKSLDVALATRGFSLLAQKKPNYSVKEVRCQDYAPSPIDPYFRGWLERFHETVKASGAELMLLTAPTPLNALSCQRYSFLHQYANKHGIKYLDLNAEFNSLGIDANKDFFDLGHLNVWGAEKTTRRIGEYLIENFKFEIDKSPERANEWRNICERYDNYKAKMTKNAVGDKSTK